ncbi:hypothetical protein BJX99DRAFT_219673 [Aspergillus californicus]
MANVPRKAHTKSRYGCDQCRRRRVKCDEQGPPCTNCVLRQLHDCAYSRVMPASLLCNGRRLNQNYQTVPSPSSPPPRPKLPAIDELELMHQFTAETYRSLCVSESENQTWQLRVPRLALRHRYLMHGILALASLHIATMREPADALAYIDAGLQYHSRSLEPFRFAIGSLTAENADAAFAQSIVTTAISLALPQLTATREKAARMTETVLTTFELLQGVKKILVIGRSWINLGLFSQGAFWTDVIGRVDGETDEALNALGALNESFHPQARVSMDVISHLRHCFMKFSCSSDPAPVLAWLAAVDKGFVDGLRRREPFFMLVLAYWGVLLRGLDGKRWWARRSGQALLTEVMDSLGTEHVLWERCIGWVRRKMASGLSVSVSPADSGCV